MRKEDNRDLPTYVASPPARSYRWVRVAAVAAVAAKVVLLILILKPSDKIPTSRVRDAQLILPGETSGQAVERITRACMVEGGLTPIDGTTASNNGGPAYLVAVFTEGPYISARQKICSERIAALGIIKPPTPEQFAAFYRIWSHSTTVYARTATTWKRLCRWMSTFRVVVSPSSDYRHRARELSVILMSQDNIRITKLAPGSGGDGDFAAGGDFDFGAGGAAAAADGFHGANDVHAVGDFAKHDVLAVEPRRDDGGDEEL